MRRERLDFSLDVSRGELIFHSKPPARLCFMRCIFQYAPHNRAARRKSFTRGRRANHHGRLIRHNAPGIGIKQPPYARQRNCEKQEAGKTDRPTDRPVKHVL